ncbi:hypothetical protein ACS0TY_008550 [Phlomoides rotata]
MEGNRRHFLNKRSKPQFKRTGGPRKGKQYDSIREEYSESFHSSDTIYRILCQSKKIGSVIGKGGNIVKALREETRAKITVSDSVPGSEERVITISSPSDKQAKRSGNNGDRVKGFDAVQPHCAAQDALLKVHDRIVEEDLGAAGNGNGDETMVSARLLVSTNTVGCLLGRKGDVIQRLRSETGANIRVLPADHLPACAMSNDELVQVSGKSAIVKKALYEISTLLHQNPRKDKPPSSYPDPYSSPGFQLSGPPMRDMLPPGNPIWLDRSTDAHRMESMPFKGGYEVQPSARGYEDFGGVSPPHDREAPSEFCIKLLCSAEKIGGVIGKGGSNVKQLEQDTGASIHVENVSKESDERVICVSSIEALWDQRSQTINAILLLQNRTSEYSEQGTITTRLLVPSSKVGCILGQGGHVINDMRRRTHADIRVFSKEEKPKCASEDEELVQISGSLGVAKDALLEIASRLRTRCLRDGHPRGEPASVRPLQGFGHTGNFRDSGLPISRSNIVPGSSGRYEHIQGSVRGYDSPRFHVPPHAPGYLEYNEVKISSVPATAGSRMSEFAATRARHHDPHSVGPDYGATEHFNSSRDLYQRPSSSAGPHNYPQPGTYHSYNSEHGMRIASPLPYRNSSRLPASYENSSYVHQGSYESVKPHGFYHI